MIMKCFYTLFISEGFFMESESGNMVFHGTTILAVRREGSVVVGGDGQVSLGNTVIKSSAVKVRHLMDGKVVSGFAGATADAFALYERLERKLKNCRNLERACVALAGEWRRDKYLRTLNAMMIVADVRSIFILTGNGDVLKPEDDIAAIGSGGCYALSAAKALVKHKSKMGAKRIVQAALEVAAEICVFTNNKFVFGEICDTEEAGL